MIQFKLKYKWFTLFFLLGISFGFVGCFDSKSKSKPNGLPNIILVMSDDQGWGDVAYNGNPIVKTPHLDQMAKEAIRFDRFYAAAPVCTPTRASCLTGRHPSRVNMDWAFKGALPAEEITIAETLKQHGYRTAHFGKWHVGQLSETVKQTYAEHPVNPNLYSPPWENGFDECFSIENTNPTFNPYYLTCGEFGADDYKMVMDKPVEYGQREDGFVWRDRFWTGPGQFHDDWLEGPLPKILMDRSLKFMESSVAEGIPFLSMIWFSSPHTPVVASPEHRALYSDLTLEQQHWFGCISAMDEQIGRLRNQLKKMGISDNTILWFCSDNGPSWVHDLNSAGPFKGKKGTLNEGGIRVPGILEWPARFTSHKVIDTPVCTSDFLPTLLAFIGQKIPHDYPIDGIDISNILDGTQNQRETPIAFQAPVLKSSAKDTKAWNNIGGKQMVWMTHQYKLMSIDNGKNWELYDMSKDKEEQQNIINLHPIILEKMKGSLGKWVLSCGESAKGMDYKK